MVPMRQLSPQVGGTFGFASGPTQVSALKDSKRNTLFSVQAVSIHDIGRISSLLLASFS